MTIKKYRSKQQIEVWQFDGTNNNFPKWIANKLVNWDIDYNSNNNFFMFIDDWGHYHTDIKHPCLNFNGCYFYKGHYFIHYLDNNNIQQVSKDRIQEFLKDFEAVE